jgi:hypothetical protein
VSAGAVRTRLRSSATCPSGVESAEYRGEPAATSAWVPSRRVPTTDEAVLTYIGRRGRSPAAVAQRFPDFDLTRLVRAQLVELTGGDAAETEAHVHDAADTRLRYVLTRRGAAAIGLHE